MRMGRELQCRVDCGQESSVGKALLETSEVLFRGDFRLKIPFRDIQAMKCSSGKLTIEFPGRSAVFHLGPAAEKWEARIRNPPGRLDKLGVKPGARILLMGFHDDDFRRDLAERQAVESRSTPELVFLGIRGRRELEKLAGLAGERVWVIYPKGVETVRESEVRAAGLAAGLVDVKVCSFSTTHTALKFTPRVANSESKRAENRRAAKSRTTRPRKPASA